MQYLENSMDCSPNSQEYIRPVLLGRQGIEWLFFYSPSQCKFPEELTYFLLAVHPHGMEIRSRNSSLKMLQTTRDRIASLELP
jgi:hypothetical protein